MHKSLNVILNIQELDIKMIRLMRVKKEHQHEMTKVHALKTDIKQKVSEKETELVELKQQIQLGEKQIQEIEARISKLEAQQSAVKKMDEFNALTQEMASTGKERRNLEHQLSDLTDKLAAEEDLIVSLKENLAVTEKNNAAIEEEINESVRKINDEGRSLLNEREALVASADQEFFKIYERLLKNKKDRVVVPIENRVCNGCHIVLTPQHENLVRKKDRLVFCEHCSRILFWQKSSEQVSEGVIGVKRRRRRTSI
ncbi:MAG: zinc ribbon domain-containing protein [Victivallaceae bacterium]